MADALVFVWGIDKWMLASISQVEKFSAPVNRRKSGERRDEDAGVDSE